MTLEYLIMLKCFTKKLATFSGLMHKGEFPMILTKGWLLDLQSYQNIKSQIYMEVLYERQLSLIEVLQERIKKRNF